MRKSTARVFGFTSILSTGLVALVLVACGGAAPAESVTPSGQAVRVGSDDPAPGLVEIGPVEVTNGRGCGLYGRRGTYEGAYTMLRNEAARRGATYVKITEQIGPHNADDCYVNSFIIRGIMYSGEAQEFGIVATTSGGEESVVYGGAESAGECSPPCSPGYACEAGTCIAVCNPTCAQGYVCAQDRTCQPAPVIAVP